MNHLEVICEKFIKPKADVMDKSLEALKHGFNLLVAEGFGALRVPKELGGKGSTDEEYFNFNETLQSYSNAVGFLLRQQQTASRLIANTSNQELKEFLAKVVAGETSVGVSVSHLRELERPKLIGRKVSDAVLLTGKVPWASGYRIFDFLVVGFFVPETEEEGLALIPFTQSSSLAIGTPIQTIALSSLQNVNLNYDNHKVNSTQLLEMNPLGTFASASTIAAIQFVNLSALARALTRELKGTEPPAFEKLYHEYTSTRSAFLKTVSNQGVHSCYATMNRIVADLLILARYQSGTQGVKVPSLIERYAREHMLFSVITLNEDLKRKCLRELRIET